MRYIYRIIKIEGRTTGKSDNWDRPIIFSLKLMWTLYILIIMYWFLTRTTRISNWIKSMSFMNSVIAYIRTKSSLRSTLHNSFGTHLMHKISQFGHFAMVGLLSCHMPYSDFLLDNWTLITRHILSLQARHGLDCKQHLYCILCTEPKKKNID